MPSEIDLLAASPSIDAEYHRLESRPERHASSDENWYHQEGSAGRDAIPDT